MSETRPTVGRIVHVEDPEGPDGCCAAIVTAATPAGNIAATVFQVVGGPYPVRGIPPFDARTPYLRSWHWPQDCRPLTCGQCDHYRADHGQSGCMVCTCGRTF